MKEYLKKILNGTDLGRVERLLMILVPLFTVIIVICIIAPTAMLFSRSLSPASVDPQSAAPSPAETGIPIIEEVYAEQVQSVSVIDGELYKYEFHIGHDGTILLRPSGEESGIFPLDTNGDGLIDVGLKWVSPQDEKDLSKGHYVSVRLFEADGSPLNELDSVLVPLGDYIPQGSWVEDGSVRRYVYRDGRYAVGLKNIDGRLYFFNQQGEAAEKLGVDVSFYNDYIDWPAVKSQGIDFAIVRVGGRGWSTGSIYEDSAFTRNFNEARKAGIKLGVYFYSTAVNTEEAEAEARYVLDKLGGAALDLPVYIDMEQSGNYPRGRMDTLSKAERSAVANAFCQTVTAGGYKPGLYSSQHYLTTMIDFSSVKGYSIWLANYTTDYRMPGFKGGYDIWQFTPYAIVRGITGVVDLNIVY